MRNLLPAASRWPGINVARCIKRVAAHLFAVVLCTPWLFASAPAQAAPGRYAIVTEAGDILGDFGGTSAATNQRGELINVLMLITDTGYLVPLDYSGELGYAGNLYFAEPDCRGDEHVASAARKATGALPAGSVYRSSSSQTARYIPRFERGARLELLSRLSVKNGKPLCSAIENTRTVFLTLPNDPQITGYEPRDNTGAIALQPPQSSAGGLLNARGAQGNATPPPLPINQQECSPGCTWGDTGNKVCDVACYIDACGYDEGDCDAESEEFLQQELAKFCSPGCTIEDLGDGFCDTACNTASCEFDRGDCAAE